MDEMKNVLEALLNAGAVSITIENGKPKINLSKKEPMLYEKKLVDTLLELGNKVDWSKVSDALKNKKGNLTDQLDEMLNRSKPEAKAEGKMEVEFPPINIYEYSDKYEFIVYATEFKKEEIRISLGKVDKQDALIIEGVRIPTDISREAPGEIKFEWMPPFSFKRTFKLKDDVDTTNIKAHFENGVLNVKLQKSLTISQIKID